MSKLAKALTAAAGNAGGESLYAEDVFSTYLYTGTGSTQTITNGIDLDGEGGLIWTKSRDSGGNYFTDTERGAGRLIASNSTDAESYTADTQKTVTGFNSDGYDLGTDTGNWGHNFNSSYDYVSWTFRKAEKFFDVVTYTGNNEVAQYVNHNLGVAPAVIILKSLDSAGKWYVWHKDLTSTSYSLRLNTTGAESVDTNYEIGLNASDTQIYIDTGSEINYGTSQYVAYLFASDAGGFGDDGSESIIKCGSYTGNNSADGPFVDLGFEPQWLLIKESSASGNSWSLYDMMRNGTMDQHLRPNASDAESIAAASPEVLPQATGFKLNTSSGRVNRSQDYIYIAIRRPMKTPESGTEVFAPVTNTGTGSAANITTNFPVDLTIVRDRNNTDDDRNFVWDRLRGNSQRLTTRTTDAEQSASHVEFDHQDKIVTAGTSTWFNSANYIFWNFKRATGFFDVVAYTGDDVSTRTVAHNLGVTPEFLIVKRRDGTGNWAVYHEGTSANPEQNYLFLNGTNQVQSSIAYWNYTAPTDTHFAVRSSNDVNGIIGGTYIAYLFATLAGVSKVGSYTGTAASQDIDCGFSSGARFIMIKRTDAAGDWWVWDSARGIVAGNDPFLQMNTSSAEVTATDYIDPLSSGFTLDPNGTGATGLNASGGTYIFLAIA